MSYQFVPIPMGSVPPEGWKPPAWWSPGGPPPWGGGSPAPPPGVWPQPPGGGKPPSWGGPVDPSWGVTPPVDPGWSGGWVPPAHVGGGPSTPPVHPWVPGHGSGPVDPGWGGGWGGGPHPWFPIQLPIYPIGPGGLPTPMPPIYTPIPPSVQYVVCFTIAVPPGAVFPPPAPPLDPTATPK